MFKVISNKMSRPGFHPDLLPQVQRGSQTPGGCVSTSVLILGVKRCSQSSSHSRNVFLYVHIRNGPLEAQLSAWGDKGHKGITPAPGRKRCLERHFFCPLGCAPGRRRRNVIHWSLLPPLVPRMTPCPERSDGQCLSHRKLHW